MAEGKMRVPVLRKYGDGSVGPGAEVIELSTVKQIFYRLEEGLVKQRRQGENLLLFKNKDPEKHTGFYARHLDYLEQDALAALYIDEGSFEDVLVAEGEYPPPALTVQITSRPWGEYCRYSSFLSALARVLLPQFLPKDSPFTGRGTTDRHYCSEYGNALLGVVHPAIEFYVREGKF